MADGAIGCLLKMTGLPMAATELEALVGRPAVAPRTGVKTAQPPRPRRAPVAYILKMYPRFSETFVLNELLELERQGVPLRIFSLKKPDDGVFHADVAKLRARVTYVPEAPLLAPGAVAAAHRDAWAAGRRPYLDTLAHALQRHRRSTFKHFLQAGYLAPLLMRERVAHVHAHFASTAASVALHIHRLTGLPYSFTAHAKDIYRYAVDRDELAAKLRNARFAVTISDYNRDHLAPLAGDTPLVRIYNGIDVHRFSPNGRRLLDPPLILGVGRLIEKKGFAYLIRACAELRAKGVRFRCLIVGHGPLEPELRALVGRLGLDDVVELSGPRPGDAVAGLYRQASVVVAPCVVGADGNRDGLPTVLLEAMAAGVPVVSTAVTGIPEVVEQEETGLIVPQRDAGALAAAIDRVLSDPVAAHALGATARARIERDFDVRSNVRVLRSLFEENAP